MLPNPTPDPWATTELQAPADLPAAFRRLYLLVPLLLAAALLGTYLGICFDRHQQARAAHPGVAVAAK